MVYRNNFYALPWRRIGQPVAVRITEDEVVIHDRKFVAVVRHRLFPKTAVGERSDCQDREPPRDSQRRLEELAQRFAELGEIGSRFLEGLLASSRYGKNQAERVLALAPTTHATTWSRHWSGPCAMEPSPWRLCGESWKHAVDPRHRWMALADDHRSYLEGLLETNPVPPRPTSDYQDLLHEEPDHGGSIIPPWEDLPERPQEGDRDDRSPESA